MPPNLPRYISLKEAAEVLSVNPKTVRRLIANNDLPGYTIGKRRGDAGRPVRVRLEDVEAVLRRIPTAGDKPGTHC